MQVWQCQRFIFQWNANENNTHFRCFLCDRITRICCLILSCMFSHFYVFTCPFLLSQHTCCSTTTLCRWGPISRLPSPWTFLWSSQMDWTSLFLFLCLITGSYLASCDVKIDCKLFQNPFHTPFPRILAACFTDNPALPKSCSINLLMMKNWKKMS